MKISVSENGNEKEVPIMNYQTNEQLSEMKLQAMKLEYKRQQELPAMADLDFDERFSMIVNAQYNRGLSKQPDSGSRQHIWQISTMILPVSLGGQM